MAKTLVFQGDSITDCGRCTSGGAGYPQNLFGPGYPGLVFGEFLLFDNGILKKTSKSSFFISIRLTLVYIMGHDIR